VYKNEVMNIQEVLDSLNKITPTMTFTMEEEVNNRINFLDITISKDDHKISFNMYRNPLQLTSSFPMTLATQQNKSLQQLDT
jgi:hypothetical protein